MYSDILRMYISHTRSHALLIYFIKLVLMVVVLAVGSGCVVFFFTN